MNNAKKMGILLSRLELTLQKLSCDTTYKYSVWLLCRQKLHDQEKARTKNHQFRGFSFAL